MTAPSSVQMKHVLPALGVGLVVGAGSAMIVHHLRNSGSRDENKSEQIERLLASIAELKQEWKEFKERFDGAKPPDESGAGTAGAGLRRNSNSGFISVHASSSDDESEWFEEAFDE